MIARRVVARFLQAKTVLGPGFALLRKLAWSGDAKAFHSAAVEFLQTLGVHVGMNIDQVRFSADWIHTLDREEIKRFQDFTNSILTAVSELNVRPGEGASETLRMLDVAERDLPWVESLTRDESDVIPHGKFKVIIAQGTSPDRLADALATLDKVSEIVGRKFPNVLYGKVFIIKGILKGEGGSQTAGSYIGSKDIINLSIYSKPDRDSLKTLIHELGHRYENRFLHGDERERFIKLSTEGDVKTYFFPLAERRGIAKDFVANQRGLRDPDYMPEPAEGRAHTWFELYPRDDFKAKVVPLIRKFRDEGDDSAEEELAAAAGMFHFGGNLKVEDRRDVYPLEASPYGGTSWGENFAESFLHFVIGKALPGPLQEFMATLGFAR